MAWVTPAQGDANTPSFGFDLSHSDISKLGPQKVTMDIYDSGPAGSLFAAGISSEQGFMPVISALQGVSKPLQMLESKPYPVQYLFTHPGVYTLWLTVNAQQANGHIYAADKEVYFVVGNKAINQVRKASDPQAKLLPEDEPLDCAAHTLKGTDPADFPLTRKEEKPSPSPEPTETSSPSPEPTETSSPSPEPTETSSPSPEPTETSSPSPEPTETSSPSPEPTETSKPTPVPELTPEQRQIVTALNELWSQAMPNHLVTKGHMDLAIAAENPNGAIETYLKDGADAAQVVKRPSGTFAIAAGQKSFAANPGPITNYSDEFAHGAYVLPQVQDPSLPWVGFSSEGVDYKGLNPGTGIDITLADFVGPGQMVTGHVGLTNDVDVQLDSKQPGKSIHYAQPAHDHQFMWFSKPGVYRANFVYRWQANDGNEYELPLVSYFLVGDEAVRIGGEAINSQQLPALPPTDGGGETPPPSGEPSESPTKPAEPAPQPSQPAEPSPQPSQPSDTESEMPKQDPPVSAPQQAPVSTSGSVNALAASPTTPAEEATDQPTAEPQVAVATQPPNAAPFGTVETAPNGNGINHWYQGSWLSGFLFGIGIMSLILGLTLLVVANRKLRQKPK